MIEALYIFDEHNNPILEHIYAGRPLSSSTILRHYLSHQPPRPSLISLPNAFPPIIIQSIIHDRLLLLCSTSADVEPLVTLEFLYRIVDALEDFLGAPLLASKIENTYDVVAQLVGEICDAGTISTTEPDALKEIVEVPSAMSNFLGGLGLPSSSPALTTRPTPSLSLQNSTTTTSGSSIPWRRSNVRHTSNELYVDIIEQLSIIYAPSGRPLSAFAHGTIVFTARISGVPDLLLSLTAPGGPSSINAIMRLPTFHPCVRLARWTQKPGELSFVPPDGRFCLAGYECNLLPDLDGAIGNEDSNISRRNERAGLSSSSEASKLDMPLTIQIRPSLGQDGEEFEVILQLHRLSKTTGLASSSTFASRTGNSRFGASSSPAFGNSSNVGLHSNSGSASQGTNASNVVPIEEIVVTIPVSEKARNVSDIRPSRGEAHYVPSDRCIEWRVSSREAATLLGGTASLRCTLVSIDAVGMGGNSSGGVDGMGDNSALRMTTDTFDYDEGTMGEGMPSTSTSGGGVGSGKTSTNKKKSASKESTEKGDDFTRRQRNALLMPRTANVSFSAKGWLASGIRVDALEVNARNSKGLGAGVTPYKGVKYHTFSRKGVEIRV